MGYEIFEMDNFDPTTHPHRRFNPLTNDYVLVSPHRTKRPWLGQVEPPQVTELPQYDESCYLCPGNPRTSGAENPLFEHTFVFENDFSAVLPAPKPAAPSPLHPLMALEVVHGGCDVLIFHPRHDLTMARLSLSDLEHVINEWIAVFETRGAQEGIKYIQIFENKGSMMGCSNPHPHGQAWSLSYIPSLPAQELASLKQYALKHNTPENQLCLLCDYARAEMKVPMNDSRIVVHNDHFVAVVPWWAIWPFEILLLPYQRHISAINQFTEAEKKAFADVLSRVTKRYDNLFSCSFAYSMGVHQSPVPPNGSADDEGTYAHLHLHFEPPLLRNATVKKFLVGFELMAEPQRDLTPEQAASRLRGCSEVHYLDAIG